MIKYIRSLLNRSTVFPRISIFPSPLITTKQHRYVYEYCTDRKGLNFTSLVFFLFDREIYIEW
ncbi:MAG: hypothetical protein ABJI60_19625 [Kangiellaceae bacterium]